MAINKRLFIYATFIISCGAIALTVTALATKSWVYSDLKSNITADNEHINYGLFSGTKFSNLFESLQVTKELYISCLVKENICAWSCNPTYEARVKELEDLYFNNTFTEKCTASTSKGGKKLLGGTTYSKRINRDDRIPDKQFINSSLRLSTIVFLSVALLFTIIGAVFAVINSAMTPIELITGIFGLYIWNAVALTCDVIVLVMWGAHFATTLTNNVAYTEVIYGLLISQDLAMLSYSYWCVLGAALLHAANLTLLGVRQVLINKEPVQTTVELEANDGDIFLY